MAAAIEVAEQFDHKFVRFALDVLEAVIEFFDLLEVLDVADLDGDVDARRLIVAGLVSVALLVVAALPLAACGSAKLVERTYYAGSDFWVAIINQSALKDPNDLVPIGRDLCKDREICLVGMWNDANRAPNMVPPTAQQQRDEIFVYGWRAATKAESTLWNCEVFPGQRKTTNCIPVSLAR